MKVNSVLQNILSFWLVVFACAERAGAHVEKLYNLEGTFGNREVIMEIRNTDGYYNARYCFLDDKLDRYMEAAYDSVTFILSSTLYNPESKQYDTLEQIEITEDSLYNWSGFCKKADGTIYAVKLYPMMRVSLKDRSIQTMKPGNSIPLYSYKRLLDLQFESAGTQKFKKGIQVEWLKEPLSGLTGFRCISGLPDSTMQKMNNWLKTMHFADIEMNFSCGTMGFIGKYQQEIEITYMTQKVLSMIKTIRSDCYNVGEVVWKVYYTLDMNSTNELILEDLLWLGDSVVPRYGSKEYYEYRRNIFGKKVTAYINSTYAKEIQRSACDYSNQKIFEDTQYYLTKNGMMLLVDHFTLPKECKNPDWTLLKFKDFLPYWNRKYLNPK